mmetsp:Transcript_45169/g.114576  ORF Transcript_45169/g.114576 Transcript_45169/m.114576 type:complete len:283 (+) Transcript_45169:903-1751(+)
MLEDELQQVAAAKELHGDEKLVLRLEPLVDPNDAGVVQAHEHLRLALQGELGVSLALERIEALLVDDLHRTLLASRFLDLNTQPNLAKVPTTEHHAHIPIFADPLLIHSSGGARGFLGCRGPYDHPLLKGRRGHRLCEMVLRVLILVVAGMVHQPKVIGGEGHLPRSLVEVVHADRNRITVLQGPGVAFHHPVVVAPSSVLAQLLDEVAEGVVSVDPYVLARGALVGDDDLTVGMPTDLHLLLGTSDLVRDAGLSQGHQLREDVAVHGREHELRGSDVLCLR